MLYWTALLESFKINTISINTGFFQGECDAIELSNQIKCSLGVVLQPVSRLLNYAGVQSTVLQCTRQNNPDKSK